MFLEWSADDVSCANYNKSLAHRGSPIPFYTDGRIDLQENDYDTLFWLPDIFVSNAKSMLMQSSSVTTKQLTAEMTEGGMCNISTMVRFAAIISCQMNFHDYPTDIQSCPIDLRSCKFFFFFIRKVSEV